MSESLTARVQRMSAPVNTMAAKVMGHGIHYDEPEYKGQSTSTNPFPMRPYPVNSLPEHNLTGQQFGRFTVVGMAALGPFWVVRCACGIYCHRKARALKAQAGSMSAMCPKCDRLERKKAGRTGAPMSRECLHAASLPMYKALNEILRNGLTPASRMEAEKALSFAEHGGGEEDAA